MKKQIIAVAALAGLLLAACSDKKTTTTSAAPVTTGASTVTTGASTVTTGAGGTFDLASVPVNDAAKACATGKTLGAGKLVIATGDPAYPPYVIDNDHPEDGKGFEAALAMAVAKSMGFDASAVSWTHTSFDTTVAGSDKNFDFNLQQISINADRQKVVSFSDPYYTANQAVVGYADGPAKGVTKLSDLKKLKLGAAAGTTSLQFITDVIKPDTAPFAYNTNADAKTALDNKQIDAIITDLPTGLYISVASEADGGVPGTKVFGQFPVADGGAGDQWGLLFVKDNPLVACTNLALQALTDSGALAAITQQWMGDYSNAPTLGKD